MHLRLFAVCVRACGVLFGDFVLAARLLERGLAMVMGGSLVMPRSLVVCRARAWIPRLRLALARF